MSNLVFTRAADRAAKRYQVALLALTEVFNAGVRSADPGSQRALLRAQTAAYEIANTFIAAESAIIDEEVIAAGASAQRETLEALDLLDEPLDEVTQSQVTARAQDLRNALCLQLERDVAAVSQGLRQMALRAHLVGRGRGVSSRMALASLRHQHATAPNFQYMDRAQRRWPSDRLVRSLWRHTLLLTWNEVAMLVMTDRGVEAAIIEHLDLNHPQRGTAISLTERPDMLDWEAVREDVFHPNSDAWLMPSLSQS